MELAKVAAAAARADGEVRRNRKHQAALLRTAHEDVARKDGLELVELACARCGAQLVCCCCASTSDE